MSKHQKAEKCNRCGSELNDWETYSEITDTLSKARMRLCPQCSKKFGDWLEEKGKKLNKKI